MNAFARGLRGRWELLALASLMAVGAFFRLYDLNWDRFQHVHPDERYIVWVAESLAWPQDWRTLLDPQRSTLSPFRWPPSEPGGVGERRSFAYGHFPLYLLAGTAHLLEKLRPLAPIAIPGPLSDYDYLPLVGRVLSALFDLGTLFLVYRLGKRLYGTGTGLLAAGFLAFTVLHIQLSHFAAFDPTMTFFVMATLLFSARLAEGGGRREAFLAGAMAGLAVGSKASAWLLIAPLMVAHWMRAWTRGPRFRGLRRRETVLLLLLSLIAAFLSFAFTNPFALLDFVAFLTELISQNAMVHGWMDVPFTLQYIGTIPYIYHLEQLLRWGMGWPLGLASLVGLADALWRGIRRQMKPGEAVLLSWTALYLGFTGGLHAKFMRYMLPLTPPLCLWGARWLLATGERLRGRAARWGWRGLVTLALMGTAAWALAFLNVYREEHPWIRASLWIYENVPEGAVLVHEHWDDALPLGLEGVPSVPRRHYKHLSLRPTDPDTPQKAKDTAHILAQADYIVLASPRNFRPILRLPERYPLTSRYYRLLFAGKLGFELAAVFSSYPRLGPWLIVDQAADESFSVYDHPMAQVFVKKRALPEEEILHLLTR